ncbi:dipeptide ABC transporter ATP-binding protein [Aneurinibacillus sp. Ricciae_BoGa-3]|uniref:ABC transporter ATP-binding protein n=1 Tax=Aneurinibacillus sp. Ricciae_BoGa-3 TaxID=3022697 RepID=UPI0023424091|nr:dipeptide ABC transporter ATP-binding protein [Aneurinibacillus sp. Ricciae_BoGa-3]WCK53478.1 dipeptide ABC transporter ATP-binding protein [Aneurinibacillus sp. Ricciae_BoGa-3]
MSEALLKVNHLKKYFPIRAGLLQKTVGHVKAVDDVSLEIHNGETLGLVGESGCGKSTTGRSILRLIEPTAGEIYFNGREIRSLSGNEMRAVYRDMQLVFQDPYASLNPRKTVESLIAEPMLIHNMYAPAERKKKVHELLERVGLNAYHAKRYPHEFSGGQRQRIGIARALGLQPKFIICDEPVSALDVSIQSQVLNLLKELQQDFNLTYLFIAHDLSVVKHISDRIGVMYLGRIVELSDKKGLYEKPLHPYTQALLSAVPVPNPSHNRDRIILEGDVPSPANPPSGCTFHPRCSACMDICRTQRPALRDLGGGHMVACHLYNE